MNWTEVSPGSCIFLIDGLIPTDTCDEIIQKFEESTEKKPGAFGAGGVDPKTKQTLELSTDGDEWQACNQAILAAYDQCVANLAGIFPGLHRLVANRTGFQIQKYEKSVGHYAWHTDILRKESFHRLAAFIIYLNTVTEGGETEFSHQQVQIQPKAGRILVFPPYWTHLHRGCVPRSSDKYVLTNFLLGQA